MKRVNGMARRMCLVTLGAVGVPEGVVDLLERVGEAVDGVLVSERWEREPAAELRQVAGQLAAIADEMRQAADEWERGWARN